MSYVQITQEAYNSILNANTLEEYQNAKALMQNNNQNDVSNEN